MVLRNDQELLIAQNAHNFVWEQHRGTYDTLAAEIETLKKAGSDHAEADERWNAMYATANNDIDFLIKGEINRYRQERAGNSTFALEERIEQLEERLQEIQQLAEEAQETAEEAQSAAEEAKGTAEEALNKLSEMEEDDN
jgi:methyl-accepting chemotaxis protein